jgi:hypothetical protein
MVRAKEEMTREKEEAGRERLCTAALAEAVAALKSDMHAVKEVDSIYLLY